MTKHEANENFIRWLQGVVGVRVDGWAGDETRREVERALTRPANVLENGPDFNGSAFFAQVRAEFGPLKQGQVDGFNVLLDALKGWHVTWVAYALSTAWHETAATMQPIKEMGGNAYFKRMYDIEGDRPAKARELGNTRPGDGALYAGRGYVQLTGRLNYARYGLEQSPDDAMKPDVAAMILRDGMEKGRFTGKAMKDYFPIPFVDRQPDYVNARRIINGTDKAQMLAGYAEKFERALRAGGWR